MVMVIKQYSIYWINLDPTVGSEVAKTRPCVVVTPDEMNQYIRTVLIVPITSTLKLYPSRVSCTVSGKDGVMMIDQMRVVDKSRLKSLIGKLSLTEIQNLKRTIEKILVQ
jgi:mRNA interferase MazF